MRFFAIVAGLSLATGACSKTEGAPVGLAIEVAPLDLPGIDYACYDLAVTGPGGRVVTLGDPAKSWHEGDTATICSWQFGNGQGGDISYVAPCDADDGDDDAPAVANNDVTVWFDGLYRDADGDHDADEDLDVGDWRDPCPGGCTLSAQCRENADTPVAFNFTVMRQAKQGFFDVAVNFSDLFCSAKLDCQDALLIDPVADKRAPTAVFGFACTSGANAAGGAAPTFLYLNDIRVECEGPPAKTYYIDPSAGEGQVGGKAPGLFEIAHYIGQEDLPGIDKCYWNTAIGLDAETLADIGQLGGNCWLRGRGTAADHALDDGHTPANTKYPVIEWNVQLTNAGGALVCGNNPLDGDGSGVRTTYTELAGEALHCQLACGTGELSCTGRPLCGEGATTTLDDNNACTTDTCDPAIGPIHTPIDVDDHNACTTDTCDPATGPSHTPIDVDDHNACTTDTCDPATGPSHTPITCDDENACNGVETCDSATGCVTGTAPTCNDNDACNGVETCDSATGCVEGTPMVCDDDDVCTTDSCNSGACVYSPVSTTYPSDYTITDQASVDAIYCIEHFASHLDVADTTTLSSLTLPKLKTIGGRLRVNNADALTSLALPQLTSTGGPVFVAGSDSLGALLLPLLTTTHSVEIDSNPALATIDFSALQHVAFDMNFGSSGISALDFPALVEIGTSGAGHFTINGLSVLTRVTAPLLQWIRSRLYVRNSDQMTSLSLPALETVGQYVLIYDNALLAQADLSALQAVGDYLEIGDNATLGSLMLGSLISITNHLSLYGNPALAAFAAPVLTAVGGQVYIVNNATITEIGLGSLVAAPGHLNITGNGNSQSAELSIDLDVLGSVSGVFSVQSNNRLVTLSLPQLAQVIASGSQSGSLFFNDNANLQTIDAPVLTTVAGYAEVANNNALTSADFNALVDAGQIGISGNSNLTRFDLSSLESVGSHLAIAANGQLTNFGVDGLANLASVGGNLAVVNSQSLLQLNLPGLRTLGGDLHLDNNGSLAALSIPALPTVGGSLRVSSIYLLTSVDLSALTRVTGDFRWLQNNALDYETGPCAILDRPPTIQGVVELVKYGSPYTCDKCIPLPPCDDLDVCNGVETCNPATGGCVAGTALNCDDGEFCSGVETCNPTTGCVSGMPVDDDVPGILLLQFECENLIDADSAGDHTFEITPAEGMVTTVDDPTGPNGRVLQLNGTAGLRLDQYVTDLEFAAGEAFTIDLWVKSNGARGDLMQMLWFEGLPFAQNIDMQSNTFLRTSVYWASNGSRVIQSPVVTSDGNWHHVAFQRNAGSGTLRFFIDGVLRGTGFYDGVLGTRSDMVMAIGVQTVQDWLWNGWLDEVRVSDTALFPTTDTIDATAFDPHDYLVETPPACVCYE